MVDFAALRNRPATPPPIVPRLIVAVTGHRPPKLDGYDAANPLRVAIRERMKQELQSDMAASSMDPRHTDSYLRQVVWNTPQPTETLALSGLAQGADWDFCTVCHQLGIPFIGVVPFPGQESRWPTKTQQQYRKLLSHCAGVVYVSKSPPQDNDEAKRLLFKRDEWLCCAADELIAVYDGSASGTGHCVRYWERLHGRRLRRIDPRDLRC